MNWNRRLLKGSFLLLVAVLFENAYLQADYKLAVAYYNQGNFQKSIDELKPDLDANPNWEFGHRLTGLCHLALKHNSLAIQFLSRAVELKSTTVSTYLGLGQAYFQLDQFGKCIEVLNRGESLAKDAEKAKLYRLRGFAYSRSHKYPEAVSDLQAALQSRNGDWSEYAELGSAYYRLDRYEDAIQALSKVMSLKPDHAASAEMLGKCYFKKGYTALSTQQFPLAVELFRKTLELNPKDAYAHFNMAEALLFLKKYPEAEKALQSAITLNPQSMEAHVRLGLVYEKQKKWTQALQAYKKAKQIKPSPAVEESIKRLQSMKGSG